MRHYFAGILLAAVLFISCSKEESLDTGMTDNGTGSGSGGSGGSGGGTGSGSGVVHATPLDRTVNYAGLADSSTSTYQYNSSKHLISFSPGDYDIISTGRSVTRNAQGVITKVAFDDGFADSSRYTVNFRNGRYTSVVGKETIMGMDIIDSTAFVYDAAGKIIREEVYSGGTVMGMTNMVLSAKTEYTYNADGNITTAKNFLVEQPNNQVSPVDEITITYDAKVNPLQLQNEAFVLQMGHLASKNNITKMTTLARGIFGTDGELIYTYNYNISNRPASAQLGIDGASPDLINYYYR